MNKFIYRLVVSAIVEIIRSWEMKNDRGGWGEGCRDRGVGGRMHVQEQWGET